MTTSIRWGKNQELGKSKKKPCECDVCMGKKHPRLVDLDLEPQKPIRISRQDQSQSYFENESCGFCKRPKSDCACDGDWEWPEDGFCKSKPKKQECDDNNWDQEDEEECLPSRVKLPLDEKYVTKECEPCDQLKPLKDQFEFPEFPAFNVEVDDINSKFYRDPQSKSWFKNCKFEVDDISKIGKMRLPEYEQMKS